MATVGAVRSQTAMSDKMMMTIAHAVNDVVLVVLKTPEILEPVGISQEKFFAKVLGYDETGLWVQFRDFELPVRVGEESGLWIPESMQKVDASAMLPWGAIATVMHFPDVEGYDKPSPFNRDIGFNNEYENKT